MSLFPVHLCTNETTALGWQSHHKLEFHFRRHQKLFCFLEDFQSSILERLKNGRAFVNYVSYLTHKSRFFQRFNKAVLVSCYFSVSRMHSRKNCFNCQSTGQTTKYVTNILHTMHRALNIDSWHIRRLRRLRFCCVNVDLWRRTYFL